MSDTPKFEVIDRRKMKAMEEKDEVKATPPEAAPEEAPALKTGPQLVETAPVAGQSEAVREELPGMPPPPTSEETRQQKSAYAASAQRVEDLVRAQNPAMGAP